MITQLTIRQDKRAAGNARWSVSFWAWKALVVAAVAAMVLAIIPELLPSIGGWLSGNGAGAFWYISRASGFAAFGLLWVSMLAGLGITSKLSRVWRGMPASFELHRFCALLGLGMGMTHALVLLGDRSLNYSLPQIFVPFFAGTYHAQWVGFGQLAFYLLAVVGLSFYFRDRLGIHAWRLIHMLSFALFLMVLIHGLKSGSASQNPWALGLYWGSASSVVLGSVYRAMSVRRGRAKSTVAAQTGLVVHAGRAQARPGQATPRPVLLSSRVAVPVRVAEVENTPAAAIQVA
jgi:predicted ferric reductase